MPIYEYECQKCKTHVEAFQKISDKPLVKCRKCGGRLEKLVSASAIQFKGSGWYVTDYSGKGKQAKEKAESERTSEDKASDKKPEKKTKESSPSSKTPTKSSSPKIPSSD
ncbi:MAG TPA: FmdB family zinc ribbon protein [Pyrinomonadaceae bacterium]|nr:FmdB family zinc ribbon protein [Pyrinomonadaceae bacterium]